MDVPLPTEKLSLPPPPLPSPSARGTEDGAASLRNRACVVLVSTGSFNPPTHMHLRMFELARDALNSEGYFVIGGYMSPVNDSYKKKGLLSAEHRIRMCELACRSSSFVMVDSWEAKQSSYQHTLTVISRIQSSICNSRLIAKESLKVMLLCGSDLLESFATPGVWIRDQVKTICGDFGVVCIRREGKDVEKLISSDEILYENKNNIIAVDELVPNQISSTKVSGEHHSGILEGWFGAHWWNGRFFVLLVTTLAVFSPLACFKRVDSLRYTSALSVVLTVVFVVITAEIAIVKLIGGSIQMPRLFPDVTDMTSFGNPFTVVPVLVTAYICHYNVHTIDNGLEDSTQIRPIVRTSHTLCSTVYITTIFFAFLLFGDGTLDDVLANFDSNLRIPYSSFLNDVVRVSYAAHLMLVFPIIFFALRINVDGLLFPSARPMSSDNRRFTLITVVLIALIFCGANFIPSIWCKSLQSHAAGHIR